MGLLIMLSGCCLGAVLALAGWLFAGLPLVVALMIWALSGPVTALLVLLGSLRDPVPSLEPETSTA